MNPSSIHDLHTIPQAAALLDESQRHPVIVYKHSPTCSLCTVAVREFESFVRGLPHAEGEIGLYQVDVLAARPASQELETLTGVRHESPQILFLSNGTCVWNASHTRVTEGALREQYVRLLKTPAA